MMTKLYSILAMGVLAFAVAAPTANAGDGTMAAEHRDGTQRADVDNTKRNARDADGNTLTPLDQGENEVDRTITQQIRKAVVGKDDFSTNAKNVKIITQDGVVTLRGPVKSSEEKATIASFAQKTAGVKRVDNQLEIERNPLRRTIMSKSVFCIAKTEGQAQRIVVDLKSAGFSNNDISVLFPDKTGTRDFAHEHHTKAPEGTAAGASVGGLLGGTLGWLAGIGSLAIPGVGPFIAAGPIMAALGGAAVGATVGGITGALVGMGIPEYEAKRYEGRIREGNYLISVHSEDSTQTSRAKEIFERAGAEDISSAGEASPPKAKAS